jgi:hypothetical protein
MWVLTNGGEAMAGAVTAGKWSNGLDGWGPSDLVETCDLLT